MRVQVVCIIHVDNANDIYHELESKDIEFVGNFQDRDYGNKDFRIKDNNGNIWFSATKGFKNINSYDISSVEYHFTL